MLLRKDRNNVKEEGRQTTGSDRYLITYADVITLLLGLFVILYSASQVHAGKFQQMRAALQSIFTADERPVKGGDGVLDGNKEGVPQPILPPYGGRTLSEIATDAEEALKKYLEIGDVAMRLDGTELNLKLSEKLLFESGKAEVQPEGRALLDTLASVLLGMNKEISVDGHTDSDPINSSRFPSNWHLSAIRATNVAYVLMEKGVPEKNMIIRGFGSQRPVDENLTEEGKAKNRRVEITISDLPPEAPSTEGYRGEQKK